MPETTTYRNALPLKSMLLEYRLEAVLGAGGFGMTYLGWDTHLEKHVAIKEYFPVELAVRALDGSLVPVTTEHRYNYRWGLERFIQEARTLAKFSHPHIVRVMRYFEANATGYMVMDYEKGESFERRLGRNPAPDEAQLKALLLPLLGGLQAVHEAGFLHRDIKPSNIFLREVGGPVLLDFGAARQAIGSATKSLTSVLTPGYAPLEQYSSDGRQGPWTDIYALGGVLYRALTGENPPDAVGRLKNDLVAQRLAAACGRASAPFLRAVEWALALDERQRPQSVAEWRRALTGEVPVPRSVHVPTVRSEAKTICAAPTVPPPAARSSLQPVRLPGKPASGWRWIGIGAVLIVLVLAAGVWEKQRATQEQARQEAARLEAERRRIEEREAKLREEQQRAREREEALRRAEAERAQQRTAGAAPPAPADAGQSPRSEPWRERPTRERTERPGRTDPEEFDRRGAETDFRSADANGDGHLTPDEVRERMPLVAKQFHRIDADGDGRISLREFMRFRRALHKQRFQR